MFDSPIYTMEADAENYAGMVATDGLGAVMTCFAGLTSAKERRGPTRAAVPAPVAESRPARSVSLPMNWRRQVGAALIALGERLMAVPPMGAPQNG
jgi:hypothetical protein